MGSCDIVIYCWQYRKIGGAEVLMDLFIVQLVHVKTLCSVLAPSHPVQVQETFFMFFIVKCTIPG